MADEVRKGVLREIGWSLYLDDEGVLTVRDSSGNVTPVGGGEGTQGPQGDPGPPGQDGADGAPGVDGDSAYEIAVAQGFVGDVNAWLASLVGEQGEQGIQGIQGPQGPEGPEGPEGPQGPPGEDGAGGGLPAGVIVMWSGALASIPSGWFLCDGQNGTPDLRDRFVVGAANGADPGATGGTATSQHAAHSGVLAHDHTVTDPGHVHVENSNNATTGPNRGWGAADTSTNTSTATGYSTASATTGLTVDSEGSGSEYTHDSLDNRPPFYAIAFIMKG